MKLKIRDVIDPSIGFVHAYEQEVEPIKKPQTLQVTRAIRQSEPNAVRIVLDNLSETVIAESKEIDVWVKLVAEIPVTPMTKEVTILCSGSGDALLDNLEAVFVKLPRPKGKPTLPSSPVVSPTRTE